MKNAELKDAIAKYIESKELVLMGYPPEYIEDVKTDMEIAFRAGAEWMAGQGWTGRGIITNPYGTPGYEELEAELIPKGVFEVGDKVVVQIRKK